MADSKLDKPLCDQARPDPARHTYLWDREVPGFGLCVTKAGTKSFVFQYRNARGRTVRHTIGKYTDKLTPDKARKIAGKLRLQVLEGRDPAEEKRRGRDAWTVKQAYDEFVKQLRPKRARHTVREYTSIFKNHVLQRLGARPLDQVLWQDIGDLHREIGETAPVQANRMLKVVARVFDFAQRNGHYPAELRNPARGHDPFPETRTRGRSLTQDELKRIGTALTKYSGVQAAALRVCLLTGLRPGEVCKATWEELSEDGRVLRLKETKTGPRVAYLGKRPADIIARQERVSRYIFPGRLDPSKPYGDLRYTWDKVREAAELPKETRLYDAGRHTYTTVAQEELGIPRWRVSLLVGHSTGDGSMTGRYTHVADRSLLADADRVSEWLWRALTTTKRRDRTGSSTTPPSANETPVRAGASTAGLCTTSLPGPVRGPGSRLSSAERGRRARRPGRLCGRPRDDRS